ncbi:branched-chain alpha-keto acid dehydrogenase subunit E2 [Streptomyces spongiicola]|uniref:Dihydrolipoamide acetyltransferase component of pyruvate dehydrogenase complex n=1 Tax=Streptomyces spongiicola TaxID=1690221 RepID=A0ABN5KNN0_9ACTN|nr:dihydrolipoamide acetyltransferase family protein [Streptomyces spongiicola]AWK10215.1 branched-chain alpha-keto acid dehydrogenase subunit E2 [Streptomyces spongiicola]
MTQVLEFRLPDLGEGLTEAEIVRWMVDVGDVVAVDQPVVEVETAKAMVEVPCPYAGVVTARFGAEGAELPVGAPLLTVAVGAREPGSAEGAGTAGDPVSAASQEEETSGNVLVGYGTGARAARRRRVRPASPTGRDRPDRPGYGTGGDSPAASGPGPVASAAGPAPGETPGPAPEPGRRAAPGAPGGTPGPSSTAREPVWDSAVESPAPDAPRGIPALGDAVLGTARSAHEGPVAVISPLVRRLARDSGVDLRKLRGSGPHGLILRVDVEHAVRVGAGATEQRVPTQPPQPTQPQEPTQPPQPSAPLTASGPVSAPDSATGTVPVSAPRPVAAPATGERIPLRGVRGAVADKLSRSRREIPDATCWVDADATELMAARTAMNAAGGPKISLLALLARICTAALARYPELNSTVDPEAWEIVRIPEVRLGFAVQTDRGLVVPVVRDAGNRTAESLTEEFARLTGKARQGTLTPADLTGGTFTLNNYGVFGVDGSTPIINHPEAAMLGVGRIVPKPWVHEGQLAVRQVVQLSLTFDHRVCDGGTAGGFLRYVADCVEQPAVLLRTL